MTKKGTEKQEFTFDWTDLNKRLNNYVYCAANDSSYDGIKTNTISSQERLETVETTVVKIVNILSNALSISLSA